MMLLLMRHVARGKATHLLYRVFGGMLPVKIFKNGALWCVLDNILLKFCPKNCKIFIFYIKIIDNVLLQWKTISLPPPPKKKNKPQSAKKILLLVKVSITLKKPQPP